MASDIPDPLFRDAVSALDAGDVETLERLLAEHPELVRHRLRGGEGYFRDPYLLWFVAQNPVRGGTLPPNATDAAGAILRAIDRERPPSRQLQLDYALALVCSGRVPRESRVQGGLIGVLLDAGADPAPALEAALAHREQAAADHLLRRGAALTLVAAACLGRTEEIPRLVQDASRRDREAALCGAALHGQVQSLALLIHHGVDVDAYGPTGFHPHATALHQAVYSGNLTAVITLVEAGAALHLKDAIHGASPRGWAEYGQRPEIEAWLRERELQGPPAALSPRRLWLLLVRPSEFFRNRTALNQWRYAGPALAVMGLAAGIDRVALQFVRTELAGSERAFAELAARYGSWPRFWAYAAVLGVLAAGLNWWIGGWWCRVRLRWSGAPDPNGRLARLLLVYASLVWAGPAVLAALAQTALYPDYPAAYEADWAFTAVVIAALFWSCLTEYRGARALFPLHATRAALWFLVVPIAFYVVVLCGAGIFALMAADGQPP